MKEYDVIVVGSGAGAIIAEKNRGKNKRAVFFPMRNKKRVATILES